ncbi:MAG: hypothetical protein SFY81_12270 [Verrucomicrobiota bacterium]|nr:hypothetical protein [Verrucomicrobiota bacterium]
MQPFGLQEWIHKFEEGEGSRAIKIAAAILLFLALAVFWNVREFKNFNNAEAMDNAQLARNIAEGKGFTTRFIRPLSISILQRQQGADAQVLENPHPDLANPPVYPLFIAGLMKILPFEYEIPSGQSFLRYQPELLIAVANQLLFLGVVLFTFRIALRLFDSGVAWTSAMALTGTQLLWDFSTSGLPSFLLMLLLLAIVWGMIVIEQASRPAEPGGDETTASKPAGAGKILGLSAFIGILLGIGALTRYSFAFLAIPVLLFIGFTAGTRKGAAVAIATLLMLACMAPWLVRNYQISGTLFGISGYAVFDQTVVFPANRMERSMPASLDIEFNKVGPSELMRKLLLNSHQIITNDLPRVGGNWLIAFFLVSLLVPFRNPSLVRLKAFLGGTLLLLLVVQALGRTWHSSPDSIITTENLLMLMLPFMAIYGVAMFYILLDQIAFPFVQLRTLTIAGFILALSLPLVITFLPPRVFPVAYPPYYPPHIQLVSSWVEPDELMMSDMPWGVAWYGRRDCVWTTLDTGASQPSDFFAIHDYQRPIHGLYLTPLTMDAKLLSQIIKGREGAWSRFVLDSMLKTNVPTGFPLKHAPRGFLPEQLFLSDRQRWNEKK